MKRESQIQSAMRRILVTVIPTVITVLTVTSHAAREAAIYLDPDQPIEKRVNDLISRLTLEEKGMVLNHRGTTIERFNLRADQWNQCLHGVCWDRPTTMFPVSIAMAATWDPALVHEEATVISDEARAVYNLWHQQPDIRAQHKGLIYRAPVINIGRNPYWGRNEEAYGEDPYLTGRIGVAYVKGLQGDDPKYLKLVSTLKHYAVNNVEQNRQSLSAAVSEQMLHEYWLPHFRNCIVEGQAQSVMASYNAINGIPNNINHYLLTDVLKKLWGFEGFVVSDLGGVATMVRGHEKGKMRYADAVAKSLIAGCDFSDKEYEQYVPIAVREGLLPEERVNDAVFRVLRNRFRLGEFDPPEMVPFTKISPDVICSAEHRTLALKAAQKSIVLLTNKDRFLPLDKGTLKKIAVIGPHADTFTPGGYSGRADRPVNPLQGIRNRAAADTEILHARGCAINERAATSVDREDSFSGGASVKLEAGTADEYIQFPVEISAPGAYQIKLHYKSFPSRGIYKLSIDGVDQGQPVDMYSSQARYDNMVSFGAKTFESVGTRQFRFTVVGKNTQSSGYTGHFDRIILDAASDRNYEAERLDYTAASGDGGDSIAQAAAIARDADVAIVYVGTTNAIEAEGRDRTSLSLPGRQEELVKAVLAANPKTVVVLMNAGSLTIPWIKEHARAILEAWWGGVEGGNAIADVLFGDVNPGGRLPHTVYASESQVPSKDEYDITKGYTYMYVKGDPLFAFGHGLSYTEFQYTNLQLSCKQMPANGSMTVNIDVENIGKRAGDEVVQLYVQDVECSVIRPIKELRGFVRITLKPGEKRTVTFTLKGEQLVFWEEVKEHRFIVEPGVFDVLIGSSSKDIRLKDQFLIKAIK
jgi:beta-glucosidase